MTAPTSTELAPLARSPADDELVDPAFDTNEQQPAGPLTDREKAAVHDALTDVFGLPSRRHSDELVGRRADIAGFGVSGGCDYDGNVAYRVNQRSGTIAVAEGTGSGVGVAIAAHGFELAMRGDMAKLRHISSAAGSMERAQRRIDDCIDTAQRILWPDVRETKSVLLATQIVDNKILFSGGQPMFVLGPDGKCTRLTNIDGGMGVHILEPGRNIVIISSGCHGNDLDTARVGQSVHDALDAAPTEGPVDSQLLAEQLHEALATDTSAGTILVAALEVKPWVDRRNRLVRGSDYVFRIPSTLAYLGLAKILHRGQKRRELYETDSVGGAIGRTVARTTDLLFNAGVLVGGFTLAKNLSTPIAPFLEDWHLPHLADLLPFGSPDAPPVPDITDPVPGIEQPTEPTFPPIEPPPVEQPSPLADTYTTARTAVSSDPLANGRASTVTNWSQDALRHYGTEAKLPAAEIDKLVHNQEVIDRVNAAFLNDTADPDNALVRDDAHHWLNEGDTYSQIAQGSAAQDVVEEVRHELGLDTPLLDAPPPPAVLPETQVAEVPATSPAITMAPVPEITPRSTWANALGWKYFSAAAAGIILGAWSLFSRQQRKKRRAAARKEVMSDRFVMPHGGKRERRLSRLGAMPSRSATQPAGRTSGSTILWDTESNLADWT